MSSIINYLQKREEDQETIFFLCLLSLIVNINYYKKIGENQDGRRGNERSSFHIPLN